MKLPLTITCIQAKIIPGAPEENTRRAQEWVANCPKIESHPHVIVFPEYFLQGLTEHNAALAEPLDGPFGQAMTAAARKIGAVVCAGFVETSPDPLRPYNSIGIWGPGCLMDAYHKTHLYDWGERHPHWKRESKAFLPGDRLGLFDIGSVRLGLMTCADGLLVEVPRALAIAQADVILYPNGRGNVPPAHAEFSASASGVPLAVCNGWGSVGPEEMNGTTRVIDHLGQSVAECPAGPGMLSVTIDVAVGRNHRRIFWPLAARRPELYGALCGQMVDDVAPNKPIDRD